MPALFLLTARADWGDHWYTTGRKAQRSRPKSPLSSYIGKETLCGVLGLDKSCPLSAGREEADARTLRGKPTLDDFR